MFVAVLQARMTSRRLPGKVMAPLAGEPMIWRQIERLRRARRLSRVMVATSDEAGDDALTAYLLSRGQGVFRGPAGDVLDCFARCAETLGSASHIVRAKGDCPFIDPVLIDEAVRLAMLTGADYVSNRQSLYPAGLEIEVVKSSALIEAAAQAQAPEHRASATAYIRANGKRFSLAALPGPRRDLSGWDWRVHDHADLMFTKAVYGALHDADPSFGMNEVLDLVEGRQDLGRFAA